ncbi:VOC family protein [Pseudoxanthomonas beigongshangi]
MRIARRSHPLLAGCLLAISAAAQAGEPPAASTTPSGLRVRDLYPLITTTAMVAARDFHVRHFGFEVLFEASWFVYLSGPGEAGTRGAALAFMTPDHPSRPPGPEVFDGDGMILTVEVADAAALHEKLLREGAPILHPLTDEPWGQRRFMTRDPAGVRVDVVQQIAPEAGYWERYVAPSR